MLSTAIWIMAALCFAGLQFYAILLGGVFNIERLTKSHFVLRNGSTHNRLCHCGLSHAFPCLPGSVLPDLRKTALGILAG